jgi:hypothetical protein
MFETFSGAVGINVTPMLEASKSGRSLRGFQANEIDADIPDQQGAC